jgi:transcriptional regulator with XRE-family HTH domain
MTGSSASLRRLGAELRRLREATGRTQTDIGTAIGRSHATMVSWEHGKTKISKSDLVCLLAELRAPTAVRKGLERLREEGLRGAGEWAVYDLPGWLRPLLSFEEDAIAVTAFEPAVVPGLLQTEEYAMALHIADPRAVTPDDLDKRVAARMRRQQRLAGKTPLRLHTVIAEAALRLQVGGPAVMTSQLQRLLDAACAENITVQVLPFAAGAHPALNSNFTVLYFADSKADPPLGYFDGPFSGYLVDDEGDMAAMVKMFDDVRHAALREEDSTRMLAAILEETTQKGADHA